MKKCVAALSALLLSIMLTACGAQSEIVHREALLPDMAESALYHEAVKENAIILAGDQPVTGRAEAEALIDTLLAEDGAELSIYQFRPTRENLPHDCLIRRFAHTDGTVSSSSAVTEDWSQTPAFGEAQPTADLRLTRYGYLTYTLPDGTQQGVQVISDRDLFADAAENEKLRETYLEPIYDTAIAASREWSSQKAAGDAILLAEDICHDQGHSFGELYPEGQVPVDDLVALLSPYFDGIDRATFLHGEYDYDAASDSIHYANEREPSTPHCRVTTSTQKDNLLRIAYHLYDDTTGEPIEGTGFVLTVQLQEDGGFRYMSNLMA